MPIIHYDEKFEKCLETLRRAGGEAAIAVRRAETLIRALGRDDDDHGMERRKRTRNGEARIENCRKYHLGSGYRLICVFQGNVLVPLHVGAHDDCDRWIENNRRLRVSVEESNLPCMEQTGSKAELRPETTGPDSALEDMKPERLSQRELRAVFRGLCER